jgi:hypothetical protein
VRKRVEARGISVVTAEIFGRHARRWIRLPRAPRLRVMRVRGVAEGRR